MMQRLDGLTWFMLVGLYIQEVNQIIKRREVISKMSPDNGILKFSRLKK